MKNVLMALEMFPPDYTGAGLRALRYSERMRKKYDYDFKVLTLNNSDKKTNYEPSPNICRLDIMTPKIIFPIFILELMIKVNKYLSERRDNIDIIHFYSFFWLNRIVMLSNILFYRKKTVLEITLDGSDDPISMVNKNLLNKILKGFTLYLFKRIDRIVVLSPFANHSCLKIGIKKEKLWLRPNPIDETIFGKIDFKKKKSLRHELGLPDKFVFLNVGIIQARKNQLFIAKCIKHLKNNNIILILIGPSDPNEDYYKKLTEYIKVNKLDKQVLIIGEKNNINEYAVASDAFVFASLREGFVNVIPEALMSGLPVVSLNIGRIKEYIDETNGIVIDDSDNKKENLLINEFTVALKQVYTQRRKYDSVDIRKIAKKHFSAKIIDGKYYELYQTLLRM